MDLVARLMVLVCLLWAGSAHAGEPAYMVYLGGSGGSDLNSYASARSYVCTWSGGRVMDTCTTTGATGSQTGNVTIVSTAHDSNAQTYTWTGNYRAQCLTGFVLSSVYDCISPPVDEPNDCPVSGTQLKDSSYQAKAGTGAGVSICIGGCLAKGAFSAKYGGVNYVTGPVVSTGQTCTGTGDGGIPPAEPVPTPCGAGKCPGSITINGTTTTACYACDSVTSESKTTSASSSASAASGAASSSSPGSTKDTISKTTCDGGECKTTTTKVTRNPDGSVSQDTTEETQDKNSFCALNPKSAQCGGTDDPSTWGGTCSGGFQCKGDAVQCAQANAAYDLSCSAKTDPSNSIVQSGMQAMTAGDRPTGHPALNAEEVNLGNQFDLTNPFGSTCPSDIQLSVLGNAVSIPLSGACDVLRVLGLVAVSFSLLGAGRMVMGSV